MIIKNGIGTEFNLSQLNEPSFLNDNRNYCQLISNQINHGIYDFVKNLVNKNSRVFDFGGNIGYFSYYIAPLVKSVDTFEPTPETFRVLEKTIKINSLDNVILHNKAISNKDGNI
jgi:tRNA/tmRNA/rRNA uracil-C5-methylase (TrmA/RlmC/RlmD family)